MTLDEAIQHCKEVAKEKCNACGAEHKQLAEWLRELQWRRDSEKRAIAAWNKRADND